MIVTVIAKNERVLYFRDHPNPSLFFAHTISKMHGGHLQVEKQEDTELIISMTLPISQNKPED
jgi:hypothetical protein